MYETNMNIKTPFLQPFLEHFKKISLSSQTSAFFIGCVHFSIHNIT